MVFKFLWASFIIFALSIIAVFLYKNPGYVDIEWFGWGVETYVPVLLLAALLFSFIFWRFFHLLRGIKNIFLFIFGKKSFRIDAKGYEEFTKAMRFAGLGNISKLERFLKGAGSYKTSGDIAEYFMAQYLISQNNEEKASKIYEKLYAANQSHVLGARGLIKLHIKNGKFDEAYKIISDLSLTSNVGDLKWFNLAKLNVEIKQARWDDALLSIKNISRYKFLTSDRSKKLESFVLTSKADQDKNIDLAKDAFATDNSNPAAAIVYARLLKKEGNGKKAFGVLESSFKKYPSVEVGAEIKQVLSNISPLERTQKIEQLYAASTKDAFAKMVLADSYIDAQIWGRADEVIKEIIAEVGYTAEVCRMGADFEIKRNKDYQKAYEYLMKAYPETNLPKTDLENELKFGSTY